MNLRILGAILKKDVRSLYPIVSIATLLFAGDVVLTRLDLIPVWTLFQFPVLLLVGTVTIFAVFQTDPPVSLVHDWLCRPVPRGELLTAKLTLLFGVLYVSRAVVTLVLEPFMGSSLAETLQKTLLFVDPAALFILPLLLFVAVVTRSILQGFIVLIATFTCVFALPTPFVGAKGPLEPIIGDALNLVGMGWLSFIPATLAPFALFALGCWFMYWRRQVRTARALLGVSFLLAVLLALLPMWLVPWKPVFAAQTTFSPPVSPASADDSNPIYLRNPRACLTATKIRDLATDPAFTAARKSGTVKTWTSEDQAEAGPDSVAFVTSIEPRRLPVEWRVRPVYVQADYYSAASPTPLYSLRPVSYVSESDGSSLSYTWVLPDHAVRRLSQEAGVELRMRYYLTLLQPHEFKLPTDGIGHAVPGIGFCSARLDPTDDHIDVNCYSGFDDPGQISAELADVPATRVYGPPSFAPRWTRAPYGADTKLTIASPRLAKADHVTVTAWTLAGYLDRSLVLPGILGNDLRTCPLPTSESGHFQKAIWRDPAKHEASSITVDDGVQLEVLDFGGEGSPIVLVPGLGATAHSYDELAPRLAANHHVYAITRRGVGYSSKPDFGFDTARLAQDILQVMDALALKKVLLVGHSIAGEELSWLGGHYPGRFSGLVYLDAAYDRSGNSQANSRLTQLHRTLPPEPPIPPEAFRNVEAMNKFMDERGHVRLPEGELIAFRNADKPYLAGAPAIDGRTQQAMQAAIESPNYAAIKIPALAIYAFGDPEGLQRPWYDADDASLKATLDELARLQEEARRKNVELFRKGVEKGQVIEMQNAHHYLIQSNQQEVLDAIEKFAAENPSGS